MPIPRLPARALVAAIVIATVLAAATADAGPQWRLRRWMTRPPIDPTIRPTVRFDAPSATSSRVRRAGPVSAYWRGR